VKPVNANEVAPAGNGGLGMWKIFTRLPGIFSLTSLAFSGIFNLADCSVGARGREQLSVRIEFSRRAFVKRIGGLPVDTACHLGSRCVRCAGHGRGGHLKKGSGTLEVKNCAARGTNPCPVDGGTLPMTTVTCLLNSAEAGDPHAAAQLLPIVYDELRRLAAHRLTQEADWQTLTPTALVHEAYLRLVGAREEVSWDGRGHFFAAAAEAMRRILVENARRKRRIKRGGDRARQHVDEAELLAPQPQENILALDEALTELKTTDRAAADLVELRYFGGLSMSEAAKVLGISQRTAERMWTFARAWLRDKVQDSVSDDNFS
jgi:RNA polymerase sigma factor (TIGR02999 family)